MPVAAWLALGVCLVCEVATRAYFVPAVVGADAWNRYYPAFDSGFAEEGVCHPDGDDEICLRTPYTDTSPSRFARKKPKDELRIFVVGTSVARGYPKPLARYLKRTMRRGAVRPRVVSLAISAIGSERVRMLFDEALELDADVIILHPHGTSEFKDRLEREYHERLHRGIGGWILHSRFVVVAKRFWLEALHLEGPVQIAPKDEAEARAAARDPKRAKRDLKITRKHVTAMLRRAEERQVRVLVVGRAHRSRAGNEDAAETSIENAINDSLRAAAQKHGATYFDLSGTVRKLPDEEPLYRDSVHFTPLGNRLVAKELARALGTLPH